MTVVALKTAKPAKPSKVVKGHSKGFVRAMNRQRAAAIGIGGVGTVLTGLSLSHLAEGVSMVAHSGDVASWAMAVGIDCGFIGLELASLLTVNDKTRREVEKYAKPGVAGTVIGSAVMNATAFAAHADGVVMQCAGVALGCAIPALIYVIMRAGAAMFVDCHNKS